MLKVEYQVRTLPNGMKCMYVPMDTAGSACSNIVYNIGSANELPGEYGLSHLLEHGMHFGSAKYNANTEGGLITDMEMFGALENATTSFFRTNYFLTVPIHYIPMVIDREADRMRGLDTKIFAQRLTKECTVVLNEMEIGQTNPMRMMMNQMYETAFRCQPMHPTIGLRKHLKAAVACNGETLLAYHKKSYTPDNATYVIAGPFSPETLTIDQLHENVEQSFGDIQSNCADPCNYEVEPAQTGMRSFTMPGEATMIALGFRGPPGTHPDSVALTVASKMLRNRLHDQLVKHGVCMQTESMWDRSRMDSLFSVWCVGFQNPEAVLGHVWSVIEDAKMQHPFTDVELNNVKAQLESSWSQELESTSGMCSALTEAISMGDPNDINGKFVTLKNLEPYHVSTAIGSWLVKEGCSQGMMYPYTVRNIPRPMADVPALVSQGTKNTGQILDFPQYTTIEPSLVSSRSNSLVSNVAAPSLGGGVYWQRPGTLNMSVRFRTDNVDTRWFSMAMNSMNSDPRIKWSASPGTAILTFNCSCDQLRQNPDLLKSVWGVKEDYHHAGERGHGMLLGMQHDVNEYAKLLMEKQLFSLPKYKDMPLQKAVDIVKDAPTRVVCVAGHPDALNIVRHEFENKNGSYSEFIPMASTSPCDVVKQQGKTSIRVLYAHALPEIGRHHPDYIPLTVAASVLGYGFGGMLMKRVRMADGLTYGISSHIEPGKFQIGASFPPRNLKRGLDDIQQVLANWKGSITQAEVSKQIRRLNLMPTTISDRADMFCKAQHSFLDASKVSACSLEDVLQAFDKHIDIHNLTCVQVG